MASIRDRLQIAEPVDNAKVLAALEQVANAAGVAAGCSKEMGVLLFKLVTSPKGKVLPEPHRDMLARRIGSGDVHRSQQLDAALSYLASTGAPDDAELCKQSGVGVVVNDEEIAAAAKALVEAERESILAARYLTNVGVLLKKLALGSDRLKWAEGAKLKAALDGAVAALLGPKTAEDLDPKAAKAAFAAKSAGAQPAAPAAKAKAPPPKAAAEGGGAAAEEAFGAERRFRPPTENFGEPPYALNSAEQLAAHLKATGGKVVTRFPPEPNGYLHIGHAKAMNMNFGFARRNGGKTILRYDDTNPEAEEGEYFDAIEREVRWLGHSFAEKTYSSSHFDRLYEFAVQLIKSGDAYVCHQTPEQVKTSRLALQEAHHAFAKEVPAAAKSPWRDRPIEENLRWFARMKQGRVAEGEAFLRFKGDLSSANPNQWDLSAYRVKFARHPHAGSGWCIYPTYDFTHCIIDSLENVTHSLCTLEFETRQAADGSYYWLLDKLGLYKPQTWEYGRLNITYNVLSKRRLNTLVTQKVVDGWDDPRLLTLAGLRRRGFSSETINKFCEQIGVTRADGVLTHYEVLEGVARAELDVCAPRLMVVLRPLKVTITNLAEARALEVRNHPKDESMGSRPMVLGQSLFIDHSDFRLEDHPSYYGLAPGKEVGLKYAGLFIRCQEVVKGPTGEPVELRVTIDLDSAARPKKEQPKGVLQWVPAEGSVRIAEVRLYDHLFTVPNVAAEDDWLKCISPNSLERVHGALGEQAVGRCKPGARVQFERVGFFVCDEDTGKGKGLCFNRILGLKESKDKAAITKAA